MFSSLGKSLKGLIMEEDPNETVAAAAPSAPIASVANLRLVSTDNQYVEALRASINARPTALTALIAAAEKLISVIPDSNMRLKAAFQMVKSEGRGVKELLEAITVHTADLESQKLQFSRAMEAESQKAIGQLQISSDSLVASTQSAQEQIKLLQTQLEQLNALIATNSVKSADTAQQISNEKNRLAQNAQQFETALMVVKNELDNHRVVIQSALS